MSHGQVLPPGVRWVELPSCSCNPVLRCPGDCLPGSRPGTRHHARDGFLARGELACSCCTPLSADFLNPMPKECSSLGFRVRWSQSLRLSWTSCTSSLKPLLQRLRRGLALAASQVCYMGDSGVRGLYYWMGLQLLCSVHLLESGHFARFITLIPWRITSKWRERYKHLALLFSVQYSSELIQYVVLPVLDCVLLVLRRPHLTSRYCVASLAFIPWCIQVFVRL